MTAFQLFPGIPFFSTLWVRGISENRISDDVGFSDLRACGVFAEALRPRAKYKARSKYQPDNHFISSFTPTRFHHVIAAVQPDRFTPCALRPSDSLAVLSLF